MLVVMLAVVAFIGTAFLVAREYSGASVPQSSSESSPGASTSNPNGEWVRRQVMILTLERMFSEENSEEIISSTSGKTKNALLEGGVLVEEGGRYTLETDSAEWTVAEGLGGNGLLPRHVDNAMSALLWENDVAWCGYQEPGRDFVSRYMNTYEAAFETQEDYLRSIENYVDCGNGAL